MKNIFSAFMVTLILVGTLIMAIDVQPVRAAGTIYIRADGSIDPPTANITTADNVTYSFTDDNYDSIVVERSNIIVDGAGYTLQGSGDGNGFYWSGINNVTIKNTNIENFDYGIWLYSSSSNSISGNNIRNNEEGIVLIFSSNIRIYHNNFVDNAQQVGSGFCTNLWDDGYPSGGNYWSDYTDIDSHKGQHQNVTGSDGVWDHPYIIDEDNQDRYPLTRPFGGPAGDVDGDRDVDIFDIVRMAGVYGAKYPNPRYDRLCDMDLDGDIDIFDLVYIAGAYGTNFEDPGFRPGADLDKDGDVDIFDIVITAGNYGTSIPEEERYADITTHVDTENHVIFGVAPHLSIFGVTRTN